MRVFMFLIWLGCVALLAVAPVRQELERRRAASSRTAATPLLVEEEPSATEQGVKGAIEGAKAGAGRTVNGLPAAWDGGSYGTACIATWTWGVRTWAPVRITVLMPSGETIEMAPVYSLAR